MSERRRRVVGRRSRYVLLGVAALLVGLLALSFALSGTGIEDAEASAETRAEQFTEAFLFPELTPELVARDITGTAYRDLLISVQAGVLSDHRVIRVRIWKAGGDLIFSTAQRDKIDEFFAREDPQIIQASRGETVSVATGDRVPPVQGLEGSDEKVYETYVPLELEDAVAPFAVVEIDQRYASILDAANRVWRLVQMFLILALVGFAGVSAIAVRQSPGAEPPAARQPRPTREERRRREEETHALASEHAERQAGMGQRLARSGRRVREMAPEEVPQDVRRRLEAAEMKLRAEQAEREQFTGEILRLRAALAEKEAELALQREGVSTQVDAAGTERIAELEAALKAAEKRAAEAPAAAKREKATTKANAELRKTQLEVEDLKLRLAEAERSTKVAGPARAAAGDAQAALATTTAALEEATAALEEARVAGEEAKAEARRAKGEAAAAAAETEEAKAEVARAVFEAERLQDELERRGADVGRVRAELDEALAEVSRLAAQRQAAATQPAPTPGAESQEPSAEGSAGETAKGSAKKRGAPDVGALEARIAEMEAQRRSEVSELQRAQQSLANTQFELMEATRKLKSAEERVVALEQGDERAAASPPAPKARPVDRGRVRHREPAREPEPAAGAEPDDAEMTVIHTATPRAATRRVETPSLEVEPDEQGEPDEESDEDLAGLSLRERLARAAAARHRTGPSSS